MAISVFKRFLVSIAVSIFVFQTHAIAYFPFTDDEERGSSGGILSGILIIIVCVIGSYFRLITIINTNRNIQSYADNFKKEGFFYDIVLAIAGDLIVSICLSMPVLLIIRLLSGPEDARTAWIFINFLTFILLLYLSRFCWKVKIKQYSQHFKQLKLVSGVIISLAIISTIALVALKAHYSKINLTDQTAIITPAAPIQTYSSPPVEQVSTKQIVDPYKEPELLIYTDSNTGLMWTRNGNIAGAQMTWDDALKWIKSLKYGGYIGWRLPTKDELKAFSRVGMNLPNAQAGGYWSNSANELKANDIWYVNMDTGEMYSTSRFNLNYVWAVGNR